MDPSLWQSSKLQHPSLAVDNFCNLPRCSEWLPNRVVLICRDVGSTQYAVLARFDASAEPPNQVLMCMIYQIPNHFRCGPFHCVLGRNPPADPMASVQLLTPVQTDLLSYL